ncbi:nucleic-acid-binding protein [Cenarchaeum symbiosum A]|uniref:Nucleic-acid-binding protein n=1 Tax=Cenarchaeum symbiosum (strain A) TaxID=414004 RepID=A0RYH2_CENSY|nr:nucleic-acid-binding protein [Cenarchaeum symbiosum A]
MSAKTEFVEQAKQGRVLARRCTSCGFIHLATVYFCRKCGSRGFEDHPIEGRGSIATYTIITVPPAGFEKYTPYAWVVMDLDGSDLRISGFMAGIGSPGDLPVGTPARVAGFDERGIIIEKAVK